MTKIITESSFMAKSLKDTLLFPSNDNQNIKEFPKLFTFPKTDSENSEEKNIEIYNKKTRKKKQSSRNNGKQWRKYIKKNS